MPIYTYVCETHGEFDCLRPFSRSHESAQCPTCDAVGERIYTAPALRIMDPATRTAMARNEASQHEPKVRRVHVCGHDHSDGSSCSGATKAGQGLKSYAGPRPWVIEHAR